MQTAELITNIKDLYIPPLNIPQQKFYYSFLSRYTDSQLDELWDITVESHLSRQPPSIGRLKEYAKDVTQLKVVCKEEDILGNDEIFYTRLGKLSLLGGWPNSYLEHCKQHGIPEQTDAVILDFQKWQHIANEAGNEMRAMISPGNPGATSCVNMRRGMVERNKKLTEQYHYVHSDNLLGERL